MEDRYGYMCKVDFDYVVGEALGGIKIYPSLEDLKENHTCWEECGIVKVKIVLVDTIAVGKY